MLMLVVLFLLGLANGVTVVTKFYSNDLTCSLQPTTIFVTQATSCTPSACTNLNAKAGSIVECPTGTVTYPAGWVYAEAWTTSNACGGTPDVILATPNNTCSGFWSGATVTLSCQNTLIYDCGASTQTCGTCASKPFVKTGVCTAGNPTTSFPISSYKMDCKSSSGSWILAPAMALLFFVLL